MEYDICVIGGAGHVGLPLAIAFANECKKVVIYDIDAGALQKINDGELPFMEEDAELVLKRVIGKTLITTTLPDVIPESQYLIVIIGTPVDEHLNPTFDKMMMFFNKILPYLRNEHVLILRSTIFPGISAKVNRMLKEKLPGIKVCFCPERIIEGKAMQELHSLPQIVSGFEDEAIKQASAIFRVIAKEIVIVAPLEAELAKLFTNSWRYIQFATANQFYMIAEEYGVDFYNVYNAMTHNYPRTKEFPKPGFAAGPCLFKDTMQISAFTNNSFFLGHCAMLINEGLPNFVIQQIKKQHPLHEMTAGILGMAFKAESDDRRQSLSYKLKKLLQVEAKEVLCSDVFIHEPGFVSEADLLSQCDIVIIGAPHKRYRDIDYSGVILVDVWNMVYQHSLHREELV